MKTKYQVKERNAKPETVEMLQSDGGMSKAACMEYVRNMMERMSLEDCRCVYYFTLHASK